MEAALSAIDVCCQEGNGWDMQLTHGNLDQRRKIADRSDLDSFVKTERGKRRNTFWDHNGTDI